MSGTEGFGIIQSAGLTPFPPLTKHQQQIVASREQEEQRERDQLNGMRETDHGSRLNVIGSIDKVPVPSGFRG